MARYVLDTNVLVRLLVQDDVQAAEEARSFLEGAHEAGDVLFVGTSTVSEVVFVLRGASYQYGREEISIGLQALLESPLLFEARERVMTARELFLRHHPDWDDCLLAATALGVPGSIVLSFDRGLDRIPGLSRVEPGRD